MATAARIGTRPLVVLHAVRVHQWSKNLLLLLPALAAQVRWTPAVAGTMAGGFVAFCCVASAGYIFNDLRDRQHDATHPSKRRRPIASGTLAATSAFWLFIVLLVLGFVASSRLPRPFQITLGTYLALTLAYSTWLKQRLVIDVLTLATLYTIRVIAGASLADVYLSRWFIAFSVFVFLSLALVKRAAELKAAEDDKTDRGRAYRTSDLQFLIAMGSGCAATSGLVYCLYITGDDVTRLYARPDVLWLGFPLVLYWLIRTWMLTVRGEMRADPVVFALRDPVSYVTMIGFLLTVWIAR